MNKRTFSYRYKMMLVICFGCFFSNETAAQVNEMYKPLHGGSFSATAVTASPDPLIRYHWNDPKANDSLQLYFLKPAKALGHPSTSFQKNNNEITVTGKGSLLLDFGTESAGWLEFESADLIDSVEMSISEYNEPAVLNAGAQNPVKTKKPARYGNTYRLELNRELYEGVRFGWIHVNHFTRPWHIKNVRLVCQVKPVNYNGSFFCNDTMLNRIWYTGAYVVKLNMLQDFLGAILMERSDRHSWTGDAYPAQAAALAAFGNYDVVKKNISFTSDQDNGIAAYSVYWVLSLIDYYNYTGDKDFVKQYAAKADLRLQKAYNEFDTLPKLNFMGWDERLGAGFENPQTQESQHTYRMLCINGWKRFSKAMLSLGDSSMYLKYEAYADEKTKQVLKDSNMLNSFGVHAVSEVVNAGLLNDHTIAQKAKQVYADRLSRLSYSPFNQCFIIQAMALAGEYDAALTAIKDMWGGQIEYGGTSFFEVYRPSWNKVLQSNDAPPNNQCGYTSLAHPWGAYVTTWLSENIGGIKSIEPGFQTFSIMPHLGYPLTVVKTTMPTPKGNIVANFNSNTGECEIEVPAGTRAAMVGFPTMGRSIRSIKIDGKESYPSAQMNWKELPDYMVLENLAPGHYNINISYSGTIQKTQNKEPRFKYNIDSFSQDSTTSGNWRNKYGKDGVKLLGYKNNDVTEKLPSYIDSIKLNLADSVIWNNSTNDSRVLQRPAGKKIAAAVITKDPIATLQTITIDVFVNKEHPFKTSLYFLDYDKMDRRSAIEIFDLETKEILAPVQLIRNYKDGKYISFNCTKAVRIRINQVRGKNAAVSGIFFDKL